jgi:hypothetical protein
VCLATGRIWPTARRFVEGLGADPPAILYNGGFVYEFSRDEVWMRVPLPLAHARDALAVLRQHPVVQPHLYVGDRLYVPAPREVTEAFTLKDGLRAEAVGDLVDWLDADQSREPMKILNIGDRQTLEVVARDIDNLPLRINHVFSEINYLEILPPGVSKGAALRAVAERLRIPREAIIAVGDNLNDLAMIEFAGVGVAMGNAPAALRERADFVAPHNDAHGLRDVIERFILAPQNDR